MGNGCGPEVLPVWLKDLLFNWFFEASCNRHDEGYAQGGDEIRRFVCDWKFYLAMHRDALRQRGLSRLIRFAQALVFFALVRAFGWLVFNYTKP